MRIRSTIAAHPWATGIAAAAVLGGVIFVLAFFEPQALLFDEEVHEGVPTAAGASTDGAGAGKGADGGQATRQPQQLGSASLSAKQGHSASGTATLLELPNGARFVRFEEDFSVTNGPDLHVYLSAAPASDAGDGFDDDYVELGGLKGNIGSQNYEIPDGTDLKRYRTAVVWCKRFSVAFAASELS